MRSRLESLVFTGIVRDITERKEAEREAEESSKNLAVANKMLEVTNVELKRSNEELDDFAYIASHDLKEPLRAIHNHSRFLIEDYEGNLDEEGVKKLHRLTFLAKRMEKLISDLLYFSRLGRQDLARKDTNLNDVIDDIRNTLHGTLEEQHVVINMTDALPTVFCDTVRVTELFRNLIVNAIKYNDSSEKQIEIGFDDSYGPNNDNHVFYVKDNGIGIDSEFHKEIFRIFKRLNNKKQYGPGTGSGLTFVKKIVEQHGGKIWIESESGNGTVFYFTLEGASA